MLEITGHKPRKGSEIRNLRDQAGVGRSAEFLRIAGMPRRQLDLALDLTPLWLKEDAKCRGCDLCFNGPPKLRPIQSAALYEAEQGGGLFAPIGVGHGKELICLLLADAVGAKRAVILTKPRLKSQMLDVDIPRYGKHFNLPIGRFTVVSYSELSDADTGGILEKLQPDWIFANEAHCLRHLSSARTKRFMRYMKEHEDCGFVGTTGTPANDSIKDYAHLMRLALRHRSPLPSGFRELEDWSRGLDVTDDPLPPGALLDLCGNEVRTEEALRLVGEGVDMQARTTPGLLARRVYRRRLIETTGVVATAEDAANCALEISGRSIEVPPVVTAQLNRLRLLWEIGEDELSEAKDVARVAKQLACGFYYRWAWPDGEKDHEWLDARSAWHKAVRHVLRYRSRPGLDSPLLVARAADLGEINLPEWAAWKAVRGRWKPHPPREAVWLSEFFLDDVMRWAEECTEETPGIVWYLHSEIGEKLAARGLKFFKPGDDSILQSRDRVAVASLNSYADGLNLQWFRKQLFTTPPSNGTLWQQGMGRSHRPGQKADVVEIEVPIHELSYRNAICSAIKDARFVEEAHGERQKLLYATRIGLNFTLAEEQWNGGLSEQ